MERADERQVGEHGDDLAATPSTEVVLEVVGVQRARDEDYWVRRDETVLPA